MPQSVDIQEVIERSTSEVSLQDLSRKGFKQVKVLNQATISKLIAEAVDIVLDSRTAEISESERERVIEESRGQFEVLARERVEEHSRVEKLEQERNSLQGEIEMLRGRLEAALELQVQRDQAIEERDRVSSELRLTRERAISLEMELGKERSRTSNPAEIENARRQMKGLESSLAGAATRIEELESQLEEADALRAERDAAAARLEELEARSAEAEERVRAAEDFARRAGTLEADLCAARESLAVALREAAVNEGRLIAKEEEIDRIRLASEELVERVSKSLGGRIGAAGGAGGASGDVLAMLSGIQENMKRLSRGGGATKALDEGDVQALLRFAEGGTDDGTAESNFSSVEVKKQTSGGVKSSLAKLRALQEGAKGDDDGTES